MTSVTIHTCSDCEYYQEPFNDYPERGIYECLNCHEYFCDKCQKSHANTCCFEKSQELEKKCEWCENETSQKCKCDEFLCDDCKKEHTVECCFG
jgi:hypothetical protein